MTNLPDFIKQLSRGENIASAWLKSRKPQHPAIELPKKKKSRARLPPFVRKTYPNGIYRGICEEKGITP